MLHIFIYICINLFFICLNQYNKVLYLALYLLVVFLIVMEIIVHDEKHIIA